MRKWKKVLVPQSVLLLILVTLDCLEARGQLLDSWSSDVRAESMQPAGAPVLFVVTLTNIGNTPIEYGSWQVYPNANWFKCSIFDAAGKVREVEPTNYIPSEVSAVTRRIDPGKWVDMPAAIDPLPTGSYTIQMGSGKRAQVVVKDDIELARKRHQQILSKIRKGDPFALHIAAKYGGKSLIQALLQDLLSEDSKTVLLAAFPLDRVPELPANSASIITKAMRKQLASLKDRRQNCGSVVTALAGLAARVGSDEALESVLELAQAEETRGSAVEALARFKQEIAVQELRRLLDDKHDGIQFRAAQVLASRKDFAALEILLQVAHNAKSPWRTYSFEALLMYRDDPRVEAAIESGLDDCDSSVRSSAEFALRTLRSAKKP